MLQYLVEGFVFFVQVRLGFDDSRGCGGGGGVGVGMELETGVCTAAVTGEDVLGEGRGGE